jgi:hypothetical protein
VTLVKRYCLYSRSQGEAAEYLLSSEASFYLLFWGTEFSFDTASFWAGALRKESKEKMDCRAHPQLLGRKGTSLTSL